MPGGASRDGFPSFARRCAARALRSHTGAWEVHAPCVLLVGRSKRESYITNSQRPTPNSQDDLRRRSPWELEVGGWESGVAELSDRQHPIEGDTVPTLLVLGYDDAGVQGT